MTKLSKEPSISIADEDRVESLVNLTQTNSKYHPSLWIKGRRRASSVLFADSGPAAFKEVGCLGQGKESTVRLFASSTLKVAVKKEKPESARSHVAKLLRLYPGLAGSIIGYELEADDARLVMPVFKGKNLYEVLDVDKAELINNLKWALSLLLAVVREIKRLHNARMVHGDLKTNNLMIDISASGEIICSAIDLSRASIVDEQSCYTPDSHEVCPHWAPERCSLPSKDEAPMTSFAQDVYSLGYLLKDFFILLKINPSETVLSEWIKAAENIEPEKRLALDDLLDILQKLESDCIYGKQFLQQEKEELSNCFEIDDLEAQKVEYKQLIVERLAEEYLHFFSEKQKLIEIRDSIIQHSKLEEGVQIELISEMLEKISNRPTASCAPI